MDRGYSLRLIFKVSLLICFFSTCYAYETDLPPRPSGPVADYAGVLDNTTKLKINSIARTLWVEEKFGLIIATVSDIGAVPVKQYAVDLYRAWGAGMKTSPENALVVISINPRVAYIHVGVGARRYISVAAVDRLLARNGVPDFSQGEFNSGILALSEELSVLVRKEKGKSAVSRVPIVPPSVIDYLIAHSARVGVFGGTLLLLLVIITLNVIFRHVHRPDHAGSGFGGGSGAFGAQIRR